MKPFATIATAVALAAAFTLAARPFAPASSSTSDLEPMPLGAFSVSLTVKDLAASKAFYEKLGFVVRGGVQEQNWLILRNGTTTIGLFQGMFEMNIMTFNPGWDGEAKQIKEYQDVREIQTLLKARGVALTTEANVDSTGPASLTLVDPDGNMILVDQHVPSPER